MIKQADGFLRICVLTILLIAGHASAQSEPQIITLALSKPGEPISLEIDILSAHIEVIGEDRKDVEFSFTVSGGGRKIITPSGTRTLTNSGYELEVEEDNNRIEVDTDGLVSKVSIVARVPKRADLELSTVNNGEIIVRDVIGKMELENINGPITAINISGSIIAEAINKDIKIGFAKVNDGDVSALSSINGKLILTLPAKAGVELHLDSNRGEIISDFEVDVKPSKPVINRNNDRDGMSVRIENTVVATINGGGPIIKMKTLNGDIQILKADK
jgi:hypothetical protein